MNQTNFLKVIIDVSGWNLVKYHNHTQHTPSHSDAHSQTWSNHLYIIKHPNELTITEQFRTKDHITHGKKSLICNTLRTHHKIPIYSERHRTHINSPHNTLERPLTLCPYTNLLCSKTIHSFTYTNYKHRAAITL